MINGISTILSNTPVQVVEKSQTLETKDSPATTKYDSYAGTSSNYDTPIYAPPNYALDDFEKNFSPDDLQYFVLWGNGTYRVPNVGAPIALKQQWLDYSKKMSKEGITPDDILKMALGNTPSSFIFFPPEGASVSSKKAFLAAAKQMDPMDFSSIMDTIRDQFAGPFAPNDFNSAAYWNRISEGASNISSYQDIFEKSLAALKKGEKQADQSNIKHMQNLEKCINTLLDTFTKYNVK